MVLFAEVDDRQLTYYIIVLPELRRFLKRLYRGGGFGICGCVVQGWAFLQLSACLRVLCASAIIERNAETQRSQRKRKGLITDK